MKLVHIETYSYPVKNELFLRALRGKDCSSEVCHCLWMIAMHRKAGSVEHSLNLVESHGGTLWLCTETPLQKSADYSSPLRNSICLIAGTWIHFQVYYCPSLSLDPWMNKNRKIKYSALFYFLNSGFKIPGVMF